jgi:hypothetical protein
MLFRSRSLSGSLELTTGPDQGRFVGRDVNDYISRAAILNAIESRS